MRRVVLAVLLGCLLGWPALAQGPVHRTSLTIGGRVVPLPPGDWTEMGRRTDARTLDRSGQPYTQDYAVLIQRRGETLVGLIEIADASTNPATRIDWSIPNICTRDDTHANLTTTAIQRSQDCLLINHFTMNPAAPPANIAEQWRGFWAWAQANQDRVPRTTLAAQYRLAGDGHVLTVTYRFTAEGGRFPRDGRAWAENGWHRGQLDAARRAEVERMRAWAVQARPIIQAAFQRGTAAGLPPFLD